MGDREAVLLLHRAMFLVPNLIPLDQINIGNLILLPLLLSIPTANNLANQHTLLRILHSDKANRLKLISIGQIDIPAFGGVQLARIVLC